MKMTLALLTFSLLLLLGCAEPFSSISEGEQSALRNVRGQACTPATSFPGIIGGEKVAALNPLSKRVALLRIEVGYEKRICTGIPISENIILTAAHCLDGVEKNQVTAVFHTDVTCESGYDSGLHSVQSADFIVHESYTDRIKGANDLALIKLAAPAPVGTLFTSLFSHKHKLSSDVVTLAGFGITTEDKKDSMFLRTLTKSYSKDMVPLVKTITLIQKDSGICSGDSGGPLFFEVDGELQLAGVNSAVRGPKEAKCHGNAIVTSVSYFKNWIEANASRLESVGL